MRTRLPISDSTGQDHAEWHKRLFRQCLRPVNLARQPLTKLLACLVVVTCLPQFAMSAAELRKLQTGDQYRISTQSTLKGWRLLIDPKTQDEKQMTLTAEGRVVFRERLLVGTNDGPPRRLFRVYDRARFQREVDKSLQEAELREAVHRLILEENNQRYVPYSPDGPLQWAEVELVAQHPILPILEMFLPAELEKEGQRWTAPKRAVLELTGQNSIDQGELRCEYRGVVDHEKKRLHQIAIVGTVVGKVGPQQVRNVVRGAVYVDSESGRTLSFRAVGTQEILGPKNKVLGKDEVDYQIVVRPIEDDAQLTDGAVSSLPAAATEELTKLVFENELLGVRFHHPRRWALVPIPEEDILLQSGESTLRLRLEAENETPSVDEYFKIVQKQMEAAKIDAKTVVEPKEVTSDVGRIGRFRLRSVTQGTPTLWEYWVVEQAPRGVTLYSRIRESDWPDVKEDAQAIIRSVEFFPPKPPPKTPDDQKGAKKDGEG